jgi:hypothetical protein
MGIAERSASLLLLPLAVLLAKPAVSRVVRLLLPPKTLLPQVAAEDTDTDDRHRFMEALQSGIQAEETAALHGSSQQRCCVAACASQPNWLQTRHAPHTTAKRTLYCLHGLF